MSLARWEPTRQLDHLNDEMDRLFGHTFRQFRDFDSDGWLPEVDVREQDGSLIVEANLPGVKKEDIQITASGDYLTIAGRSSEEKEEKRKGYYARERRSGRFERTIAFPVPVDTSQVEATYADGTAKITLPKKAGSKVQTIPLH